MIRLVMGANTVALTLKEKTTVLNPVYLFEFENSQTHSKFYCIASDTSLYKDRYNLFTITVVSGTPTPLSGQIKLTLGDEYNYTVYQQQSTTNLNPANASGVVEQGYMTFDKSLTERKSYNGADTTRRGYES